MGTPDPGAAGRNAVLADTLARQPQVLDAVVLDRRATDGRRYRVGYLVPAPSAAPAAVRRVADATALAASGPEEPPFLATIVSRIPRSGSGAPDEPALRAIPVPASTGMPLVPAAAPEPERLHLGTVLDLPSPWGPSDIFRESAEAGEARPALSLKMRPSTCEGGPLAVEPDDPATVPEALLRAARRWPDRGVHVVGADGTLLLRYPELLDAARRMLTGLRSAGLGAGDVLILHAESLADHFVGLWACLLGGILPVAVAQAPGYHARNAVLDKLEHAWRSLGHPSVLAGGDTLTGLRGYCAREGLAGVRVLDAAEFVAAEPAAELHRPEPGDVAMLQLSSGSTGRSKVIQLTHRGIIRYAQGARAVSRMRTGDVFVNWLALDHVAGLVMYHLGPVVLGCDNVHVPTPVVLAEPLRWLDLLHRYRAQHSWSPNFGYKLVTEALRTDPGREWDLSGLRSLVNAGEQCTLRVTQQFVNAVRRYGVTEQTVLLAWGMAETCTAITYQPFGPAAVQHIREAVPDRALDLVPEPRPGGSTFLSMGPPAPGSRMRIAGRDGVTELPERHIGRLQVRSDRVTPGYLNNPDANRAAFPDGEWLDTGDLAFVVDGRITITGREKEIIIINGVHYFCHEIEDAVGALDGVASGLVAAVGVPSEDGTERAAVLFVPADGGPDAAIVDAATVDRIRRALAEKLQLTSPIVVAVPRVRFDRTTSGKIQRTRMRARLLAGEYDQGLRAVELAEQGPHTVPDCLYRLEWTPRQLPRRPAGDPADAPLLVVGPDGGEGASGLAAAVLARVPDAVPVTPGQLCRELFDELRTAGRTPARILLATSYLDTPDLTGDTATDNAIDRCVVDLSALVEAVIAAGWSGEIITLSRGLYRVTGTESECFPAALTAALGETVALEQPQLRVWHLDLPGDTVPEDAEAVVEALRWAHREPVVAWRGGPHVRVLTRVEPVAGRAAALERGSFWLVTGGLGGIGRAVLPGLVADLGVRLLVVGRSPRGGGSEPLAGVPAEQVRYASVDICAAGALEATVAEAEATWGVRLAGVLHLAGGYEFGPVAGQPPTRWLAAAAPKVYGSLQVARVLLRRPGSRLVAFSSLLSLLPVVGGSAYAAGNRFLEALCGHLSRRVEVHCLTWGTWRGTGMSAGHGYAERAIGQRMLSLTRTEGVALTRLVLHQPPGHLLVGVDPAAAQASALVRRARALEAVRGAAGEPAPEDAFGIPVPVRCDTPAAVTPVIGPAPPARTGPDGIGVGRLVRAAVGRLVPGEIEEHTPFHEVGVGSVQLVQLHAHLQRELGREFPLTTLFSHPTVAALGAHLAERFGAEPTRAAGPAVPAGTDRRIAIIGMAARFPGADTLDQYWTNLLGGRISVRRFAREELLAAGLPASLVDDPDFVPVSGALDDIAGFDAELFGITAREAELTEPQQRLFLQICHEALEHAGYAGTGDRVGVYAGAGMYLYSLRTYLLELLTGMDRGDPVTALQVAIGNLSDFLATRVSYRLGLTGPAVGVQTACSTSLVAVHLASQALLAGDADLALAGAAAVHVPQALGYRYQEGSILSRTGACRAFDAGADGTVGGNGVAAVVLKRLDTALADGDPIHAVILGSAVNNDGTTKVGYTSPSVSGQADVIRRALTAAGVQPATIGYVEAHGTGTKLGDPIEVAALREVFGERRDPVLLGSVKPNIGHLDTCAGMAGLIKAVLAVRHGQVPPLAGLREPNPALELAGGPFRLPTEPQSWPVPGPRRAGVTALGVGGTNAHVVLEEPPPETVRAPDEPSIAVVPLSAQHPAALAALADRMADRLAGPTSPRAEDLLTTLSAGRRRLRHRLVAWGGSAASAAVSLRAAAGVTPGAESMTGTAPSGGPGPVVFAFTGQGVDCTAMASGLLESYRPVREVLHRCAEAYRQTWGTDLLEMMRLPRYEWTTADVQPALFAWQLALARLLESVGLRPDVLIGHSAGEYAALCLAGALPLEDGLYLAAVRGRLMQRDTAPGGMLAVFAGAEQVQETVARVPGLELAVHNGPDHYVLAGDPAAVTRAEELLAEADVRCRRLPVRRAFHTALLDPVLDELSRQAAGLAWAPLRLPVVTNLGGALLEPGTLLGAEHVRRQTRAVAEYGPAVDRLVADGYRTFVEIGPDAVLSGLGRQWSQTTWIPLQRARADRRSALTAALGSLFCQGFEVDWTGIAPGGRRIPLPTYPFQLTRHWVDRPSTREGGSPDMPTSSGGTDGKRDAVLARVRELTARYTGEPVERIAADTAFFDLGADSLLMINLLRELETAFGLRIAMRELFEELDTPELLADAIAARMDPSRVDVAPAEASPPAPAPPAPAPVEFAAVSPAPPADGMEALVRSQLDVMEQFSRVMSEQLAALSGNGHASAPPAGPVVPAQPASRVAAAAQHGPRVTVDHRAGMSADRLTAPQQAHFTDLVDRYTAKTATSKRIAQRHRRSLADSRAVVGFRGATKEMLYPIAARRAAGAYLEDVDGNTYVDITMGFGTLLFGHEPRFLADAVRAHLDQGLRLGPRSEETGQAAELLCELTGMDRTAFCTSGTEANSGAFRLARAFTGRSMLVTFDGSYHGHFDAVLGRSMRDADGLRTVPISAGIPESAVSELMVLGYGDEESLELIRRHADRIAAVVVEPVPSRYPDRQPVEFVRRLRELCDRYGMVLMFDEMLTGFRPHPQGAQGVFGVRPDLATYGKVIGGGFPIGAIAGRADIMDWIDGGFWQYGDDSVPPQETTFFGGTYIQHPLSMVAAKAVLTRLRESGPALQQRLNAQTDRLAGTLNDFFTAEDFPLRIRHFGSLFRFAHRGNLELLYNHLVLRGVHVWEWRNFFLSDAHTDADVDFVVDAVRDSLHDLRRGGFLPGGSVPPRAAAIRTLPALSTLPAFAVAPEPARAEASAGIVAKPDFSLYFFGDYPRDMTGDKYQVVLEAARYADQHGLRAVWLPERHFDSFGGVFPNPSVLAAAIAAQTSRVRLHAGSVVLPLHDPIRVAEEWSVVDNLSAGRVGLGFASGWHAQDFALAPQAYGRHRDLMYEGIEQVRALWRGEPLTRTAGGGEQVRVRLFPRPVQDMPPMFTAVVGNPDSYRRAAAADLGIITNLMAQSVAQLEDSIALYRRTRAEHGLDPAAGRVVVLLHTYLGEDTARARAEAFGPFCAYLRSSLALFGQVTNSLGFSIDLENTPAEDMDFLLDRAFQRYCEDRALIGSPEDGAPIVRQLTGIGVDEIACFVDFGLSPELVAAGLPAIGRLRALLTPEPAPAVMPMPAGQRRIWFTSQLHPDQPTYTESQVVLLDGNLDVAALRQALDTVVARHPALRTVFREVDGEPCQIVLPERAVPLPVHEHPGGTEQAAASAIAEETAHVFDLAAQPPFEPRLLRLADDRHLLVLRMHHLVMDTWSAEILTREISASYRAALTGAAPPLPPVPSTVDSAGADRDKVAADLAYWTGHLAGRTAGSDLATDQARPADPTGRGAVRQLVLDAELTARLRQFCRQHRVTVFMTLLAGFAAVLRQLAGRPGVVIGTPAADRPRGTEAAVGFFLNTLPLCVDVDDRAGFGDLVRAARSVVLDAQEHQDVGFDEIVRAVGAGGDPRRNPIFDVVIEYDNNPVFELDLPGVRATLLDVAVERAPFDLTLFLTDRGEQIRCQLNYATDVYHEDTARRILDRFRLVLDAGTGASRQPLSELPAVPAEEEATLAGWQDGGPPAESTGLLHRGDGRRPPGTAVVDERGRHARDEVDRRADAVAAALADAGVGAGATVAVLLPRGADAVVAMLGVLRAGAAYLPLDPEQPAARLAMIVADADTAAVVTRADTEGTVGAGLPTVLVDQLVDPTSADPPVPAADDPAALAYVLFTSGSTGRPKGCAIEQQAISNTVSWYIRDFGITEADRLCWFASPGFDASCLEVWSAVWTGAELYVVPPECRLDVEALRDWLVANAITGALLPIAVVEPLMDLDWPTDPRPALRYVLTGGDRLRRGVPADLPFQVINGYGPTEAAVCATWVPVPVDGAGPPPIGRPVPGTFVRVLDEHGRPAPIGAPGELYLGGIQLARGYLGRVTAEDAARFDSRPGHGRLFRTGDVVRWRHDGQLEFIGRNDDQVQIRGHRVETGEVEYHLRRLDGVRDAAVRTWRDDQGNAYLAGYVVPAGDEVSPARLRAQLVATLPEYLIPTAWRIQPALPLNAADKVDRAALPPVVQMSDVDDAGSATPTTDLERRLCEVWRDELGLTSVGMDTSFFALGGHSLAAVRLVNRVRAELGTAPDLLSFLRAPTVRAMAGLMTDPDPGTDRAVVRTAPAGVSQAGFYRTTTTTRFPSVATVAQRFSFGGAVDPDALRAALAALAARHPALRTRYHVRGDEISQQVLAPAPVPVTVLSTTVAEVDRTVTGWAEEPFALEESPAFRVAVVNLTGPDAADGADRRSELVLALHHGICDGWSMTVLARDLGELYRAAVTATAPDLPVLTADFVEFVDWERRYLDDPATRQLVQEWVSHAGDDVAPVLLPTDRPRPAQPSGAGEALVTQLPPDLVAAAEELGRRRGSTLFAVLAAAFALLVHRLTEAPTVLLAAPVANRVEERFENVVGLLANTVWLLVPVAGAGSFTELVDRATESVRQLLAMQSLPRVFLLDALGDRLGSNPPRIGFSLVSTPPAVLELAGCGQAVARDVPLPGARSDQYWLICPDGDGGMVLTVEYALDLFEQESVAALADRYRNLLRTLLADPAGPLTRAQQSIKLI